MKEIIMSGQILSMMNNNKIIYKLLTQKDWQRYNGHFGDPLVLTRGQYTIKLIRKFLSDKIFYFFCVEYKSRNLENIIVTPNCKEYKEINRWYLNFKQLYIPLNYKKDKPLEELL
jgi:hypothetical protein